MPLIRLSSEHWTTLAEGCWALGPQDVEWKSKRPPAATTVLLQGAQDRWLIDCGAGEPRHALIMNAPTSPTQLLLTHAHPDHATHLSRWLHLPCWMSHSNQKSWLHDAYVRGHWDRYNQQAPLAKGVSRHAVLAAFPDLALSLEVADEDWDEMVQERILAAGQAFYGTEPPFHQTRSLEELPLRQIQIGEESWQGWQLGELWVFPSRGHAPDQVIAWWAPQQLWILSDETSAAPVWTDSDQHATLELQRKVMGSLSEESMLLGGHQSFAIVGRQDCTQFLKRLIDLGLTLREACRPPRSADQLLQELEQTSWMQPFLRGQFPQGLFFAKQFIHNWQIALHSGEPSR